MALTMAERMLRSEMKKGRKNQFRVFVSTIWETVWFTY